MEGYTYLFFQTLPIVSAVALIFCLMGLFFGASKYRSQLKENEAAREKLSAELSELRKGQKAVAKELDAARNELRQLRSDKAKVRPVDAGTVDAEPLGPALAAAELKKSSGPVDLGEIFESRPEQVDDLKKVRGIAKVMERKLNAEGIYTFAQIARWSDEAAEEFGARLAIVGNISRYQWREQCARLHQEKYHTEA